MASSARIVAAGAPPAAIRASGPPRPIRVLHFHSSKGLYGPERWTHLALRALAGTGVEQEVLTIGTKPGYDDFARFLAREGFRAHHLDLGGKLALRQIVGIRSRVVDGRFGVLHTHGFKSDILGYLATRGLPIGLVTTPHGWCDHESFRIRAYETVGRNLLRRFDRVYPLSDHQLEALGPYRLGPKVRRIRNAVDIAAFDDVYAQRRTSTPSQPTVLFVGRLVREKGLFDLIEATGLVARRRACRLVIAGAGPGADEARTIAARAGIADRIELTGFVEDVRRHLLGATVLALPSYSEGIPRVVMEAFAAGVAVVGTEIPGLRELVRSGHSGMLVPVGDVVALADAIDTLLGDAATNRRLAEQARTLVERDYSPHRLAAELLEEYQALVGGRADGNQA
ncbi:MAG: glycosyltransferase family 4 protein [Deltaproteobacteria bacterium]|nr:glycosyltransferase family 4 protein [Deltaproteobacteria bacterium]